MKDTVNDMQNGAKARLKEGAKTVKESTQDWLGYVKTHPLQAVLFGIIGYFSIKGLLQD